MWLKRYRPAHLPFWTASDIAISPDGSSVFVYGTTYADPPGGVIIAYDTAHGRTLWTASFGESGSNETKLTVSPDSTRVYATGLGCAGGTCGLLTAAYDAATGAVIWASAHEQAGNWNGNGLAVSPDGSRLVVLGAGVMVAYEASDGAQVWDREYTRVEPTSLAMSPNGANVFVAARSWDGYRTTAYRAKTGRMLWVSHYAGRGRYGDIPLAISVSPDSAEVFVTGTSNGGSTTGQDYATVAYQVSTGVQLWASRYDGPEHGNDAASSIVVSPDGAKVYVTGESGAASEHYATVAYDAATGTQIWASRSENVYGSVRLAVSPDGSRVYITGAAFVPGEYFDYLTAAFDGGTGGVVWESLYDDPQSSSDLAAGVVVSPDGNRVFVTGICRHVLRTIAYAA